MRGCLRVLGRSVLPFIFLGLGCGPSEKQNTSAGSSTASQLDWAKEHKRLWTELVPPSGQASTVQGEVIRCTGKLTDEAYRNGNLNWDDGSIRMCRFIETSLDDTRTFTPGECKQIRDAAKKIIEQYDRPDLSGAGSPYYFLSEMAVRWCLANPVPKPRQPDPALKR